MAPSPDAKAITTNSSDETFKAGKKFARKLKSGDRVLIEGELGAGKTVFIKGIASGLGIPESRITSPTFVFIQRHKTKKGFFFYHIDLYRIDKPREIFSIGLEEILADKRAVIAIEWGEKLPNPPDNSCFVKIEVISDKKRRIGVARPAP